MMGHKKIRPYKTRCEVEREWVGIDNWWIRRHRIARLRAEREENFVVVEKEGA